MLGLGAIPAGAVIYMRTRMPESPRYVANVQGKVAEAKANLSQFTGKDVGSVSGSTASPRRMTFREFISNPKYLRYLLGTAGAWFFFDYAYYGNSISMPMVLKAVSPSSSPNTTMAWTLIVFAVAAVPGYILAFSKMDKIGHRKLQLIGFACMGAAFGVIGFVPHMTVLVLPFLLVFGASYFFAEFGPNTTTFVMAAEVYPTSMRTTGHGISAGVAKAGAFIGVFVFPILKGAFGIKGTLSITFVFAVCGFLVTLLLPEPSQRSLEELSGEDEPLGPVSPHDVVNG
jgi:MFS family permease